jgi:hypothetical protein
VTGILVFCRNCGKQVSSGEMRDGLCLDCRVSFALADLRREHARLWRKRERYRSSGANYDSIGRQVARIENRMAEKIREMVTNDKQASEYLKKELEAARGARYTISRSG